VRREHTGIVPPVIKAVIFDYGGVISSPLFRGIGEFEAAEGYRKGSLLQLLFGETHYIGVHGRSVADEVAAGIADEVAAGIADEVAAGIIDEVAADIADEVGGDPDVLESEGEADDIPAWHRLERGEIDMAAYFGMIVERAPGVLGRPIDVDAYGRFMRSSAPGVHWQVVHRIRDLRGHVRLGLLTNNVKEFGEHWRATFPIDELFEVIVDSSHVGMRKPEPDIYLLTCRQLAVEPTEAVFVDDNADNCAAARALGMETVHFGDDPRVALAELDAILERRGIA
jgi:putative hydrolase of the HAD superfamily